MKKISLLCLAAFYALTLNAQIKLAPIYTNDMVIKRNAEVPIWGWGNASERVTVIASWAPRDTVRTIVAPDGRWKAILKTPQADLVAHSIRVNDLKLTNVMLGEVWLCSGQSNMEWSVSHGGIMDGEKEAMAATFPNIRIFRVPKRGADSPQVSLDAKWTTCIPETMREASAVGYFFARKLHGELNIPIGFISSAWGGTAAEPWIPMGKLDQKLFDDRIQNEAPWWPAYPGTLYNQMIHPLVPFVISGAIWYQGESNREKAYNYDAVMKTLIESWREIFGEKMPFYFVQIAPHTYERNKNTYATELREAQEKTAATVEGTGMVVVSDLVNDIKNIHPANKQDVGARLASFALAEVYDKPIKDYKSPTYKSMTVNGDRVLISFNNPTSEIRCTGTKIEGFKVAGADGVLVDAEAAVKGNQVEVWAKGVKKPVVVRYCFDDYTFGNLQSAAGLPVAPFRTDRSF